MILIFDIMGVVLLGGRLNQPLLDLLATYRAQGIRIYFASNMGLKDKKALWPSLQPYAEALFCSEELGFDKPQYDFYRKMVQITGIVPEEIVFFDDSPTNVAAAQACGWRAFLYHDVVHTQQQIKDLSND
jgi:putative hydrolase of the HAD superfamily